MSQNQAGSNPRFGPSPQPPQWKYGFNADGVPVATFNGQAFGGGSTSGVTSFNARVGAVTLESTDVTDALGFTPVETFNGRSGAVTLTSGDVTTALGYTPPQNAVTSFEGRSGAVTLESADIEAAIGGTPVTSAESIGDGASAYTNETTSRAELKEYTNTTGRPLFVSAQFTTTGSPATAYFSIAGVSVVRRSCGTSGVVDGLSCIVPIGATYELSLINATLTHWYEY